MLHRAKSKIGSLNLFPEGGLREKTVTGLQVFLGYILPLLAHSKRISNAFQPCSEPCVLIIEDVGGLHKKIGAGLPARNENGGIAAARFICI